MVGCSLTLHPAANGDPMAKLGRDKGGEERNWPPTSQSRWLRTSVLSNRHSQRMNRIWDLPLPFINHLQWEYENQLIIFFRATNLLLDTMETFGIWAFQDTCWHIFPLKKLPTKPCFLVLSESHFHNLFSIRQWPIAALLKRPILWCNGHPT